MVVCSEETAPRQDGGRARIVEKVAKQRSRCALHVLERLGGWKIDGRHGGGWVWMMRG